MNVTQDALFDTLVALSSLTSLLSTYQSVPAIFTRRPVPDSADYIYVTISDAVADEPWDTKTTTGRQALHDIGVYGAADGDPTNVQLAAELIRDALHRNPVTVSGYGNLIAVVSGPVTAPAEDDVYGRIVSVRFNMIRA